MHRWLASVLMSTRTLFLCISRFSRKSCAKLGNGFYIKSVVFLVSQITRMCICECVGLGVLANTSMCFKFV